MSLVRKASGRDTYASVLADAGAAEAAGAERRDAAPGAEDARAPRPSGPGRDTASIAAPLPDRDAWLNELQRRLAQAAWPTAVSPTGLARLASQAVAALPSSGPPAGDATEAEVVSGGDDSELVDPGLAKDRDDSERPAWRKGRYGTAVGSAVHGVLQDVSLDTGRDAEALARRQAAAEGVPARSGDVTRLVRSALDTEVARQAARAEHCWRELFVAAPFDGRVLEGYIDLAYRDSAGRLVVVDWKTDAVEGDDDLDDKLARYRLQGAAYVAALEAVTGEEVARMVFVFISRHGAVEVELPDLRSAVEDAKTAVAALGGP